MAKNVKVTLNLKTFRQDLDRELEQVMQNVALAVEAEAKQNAPVDTGFLRNSITTDKDADGFVVYVGADYGYAQEARRSYLGAAADRVDVEAIAKATLRI